MLVTQMILPLIECPKQQVNRVLIIHTGYILIVYAHLLDVYVLLYTVVPLTGSPYLVLWGLSSKSF